MVPINGELENQKGSEIEATILVYIGEYCKRGGIPQ